MKNFNIKDSFKTKKFKYGGYSALITIVVIGIVFALNLVINKYDFKLDLTKNKMYSISDQSKNILKSLDKEVKITALYESGKEDSGMKELLNKYKSESKYLTIEYKDPIQYPQIAKQYAQNGGNLTTNSLIVESGNKYKILDSSKLVNYDSQSGQVQSFVAEQSITGALQYVTSEVNPVIYALSGHEEAPIDGALKNAIENENYSIKELNLLTDNIKVEENQILMITAPKRDLSVEEAQKLKEYFNNGGRAIFAMENATIKDDLPNFQKVYEGFGLKLDKAVIVESDQQHSVNNPMYLMPNMNDHEILKSITSAKLPIIIPVAEPIEQLQLKKQSIKIEPLLTTTDQSWAKVNLTSNSLQKESGDIAGPFNIAIAASDSDTNSKIIIISSTAFLNDSIASSSRVGNIDFIMNSLSWVQNSKQLTSIRAKDPNPTYLGMNTTQQILYSGFVVIVIPLIIVILGVSVWVRRKNL